MNMNILQLNMFVLCAWSRRSEASSARITFFFKFLKTFSKYTELEICKNGEFQLPPPEGMDLLPFANCFQLRAELKIRLFAPVSCIWGVSIALLHLLRIHCRAIVGGPRTLFPAAGWDTMLVQTLIHQAVCISYLLRRNFPHAREVQIHRLRLCHCPSLFQVAFLSSLGRDTLLPDRIRKKMAGDGCKKTSSNSLCSTIEEDGPTHHVWNYLLVRMSASCQHIWFGSWCPNWFCQAQLCRFWRHVSLSGFFPLESSWSLLRCLQTHTTKLPDEKSWRLME